MCKNEKRIEKKKYQKSTKRVIIFLLYSPSSKFPFSAGLLFLTAFALINFLNLTSCVCLLIGTLQKKKNLLVPYLVVTSLYILIYLGLGVYFFVSVRNEDIKNGIITVAVLIINLYCVFVVLQLYRLLKLREQNFPAFLRETNRQQQMAQNYETTYSKIP
jgi:hypothetical protein